MSLRIPIIAIAGRPNVGKSTLFNRVAGARLAVVEDFPGVTRDRNYALVERFPVPFYIVDTGGFEKDPQGEIEKLVVEQALLAAEEADLIIALFDGKAGCQGADGDVVQMLRRYDKPVVYGVNKCDGKEHVSLTYDFYALGVEDLHDLSALHGRGVDQFIENVLKRLPHYDALLAAEDARRERERETAVELEAVYGAAGDAELAQEESGIETDEPELPEAGGVLAAEVAAYRPPPVFVEGESAMSQAEYLRTHKLLTLAESEDASRGGAGDAGAAGVEHEEAAQAPAQMPCIRVAIIGRPNTGKSTLLNTLTGEQRAITSPYAGTTRDPVNLHLVRDGQEYELVDTAGLRREARVSDKIEKYSTLRALHALGECDVAIVLIDSVEGPTEQDGKIVGLAHEQGKGIVLAVNKWDLVEKDHRTMQTFKQQIREAFKFAPYAPLLFISAKTGKRCPRILETVRLVAESRMRRVSTNQLNRLLKSAAQRVSAPSYRGRPVKLYYAAQVDCAPPRFLLFFNYPQQVHFSYLRFLKNAIREEFGFHGTDIKLATRKRGKEQ